jgi:hypothetical protein
MPPRTRN